MVFVLSYPSSVYDLIAIITPIWGFRVGIWVTSPGIANAAPHFFGRPDHVVQEKYLLQSRHPGRVCLHSPTFICLHMPT